MKSRKEKLISILALITGGELSKYPTSYSDESFKLKFELLPEDFIRFAEEDLSGKVSHSLTNALSNIKRAIDCRVDSLLVLFAVYEKAKRERWNFPRKVSFLKEIGLLAPRVLERINAKRNKLEHEYKRPKKSEAEDALDIAMLFIDSTNMFLKKGFEDFEWESGKDGPWLRIELKSKEGYFRLNLYRLEDYSGTVRVPSIEWDVFTLLLREWVASIKRN